MKRTKWIAFLCFAFLMAGLGANDALRGIFAPVFQERYDLNGSQLSLIVTISYVGNLLFLSIGGKLLDLFPRKNVASAGANPLDKKQHIYHKARISCEHRRSQYIDRSI